MNLVSEQPSVHRFTTDRITGLSAERAAAEIALERAGILLPFQQRARWQRLDDNHGSILIVARESTAGPVGAASVSIGNSRALPGHKIYRVERLAGAKIAGVNDALVSEIVAIGRQDPRCLRVAVDVFDRSADARRALAHSLARSGFERIAVPRLYSHTAAIDLTRSQAEIFAGLHATARRHIRAASKHGLRIRTIDHPKWATQLRDLSRTSFHRTGSTQQDAPWEGLISLSAEQPTVSRLVGVFAPVHAGSEVLVSYAWGVADGSRATYEAGGSMRHPELGNLPVGYAALWNLIAWAHDHTSASWFDLGGITPASDADPRAGISRFKQYFSRDVIDVGEEWRFAPHPARAAIASAVGGIATWATERVDALRRADPAPASRSPVEESRASQ